MDFVIGVVHTPVALSRYLKKWSISFARDTSAATAFFIARNRRLTDLDLSALRLLRSLPAGVLAPVERSHGFRFELVPPAWPVTPVSIRPPCRASNSSFN